MAIRVLVADDHEVVRMGLKALLTGPDVEVVGIAKSGTEVLETIDSLNPDVVMLDVRMPDDEGLQTLEVLRQKSPELGIIMLSTYDNPTYIARAIALGANDYILKGSSKNDILDSVRRVAKRELPTESNVMRRVRATMARRKDRADSKDVPLTNRELQVLRHIALGLSNREIGSSLGISVETVKEHVQNILRKLDSPDRTAAAVWAVKLGLV